MTAESARGTESAKESEVSEEMLDVSVQSFHELQEMTALLRELISEVRMLPGRLRSAVQLALEANSYGGRSESSGSEERNEGEGDEERDGGDEGGKEGDEAGGSEEEDGEGDKDEDVVME